MGRNIGTLGRAREALDLEFGYFGSTIRIHPQASDAVELEFLRAAEEIDISALQGVDLAQVEAMGVDEQAQVLRTLSQATRAAHQAMLTALRQLIHPDDWDTYWRLAREHGQQTRDLMADVRAITAAVVEATTDFRTGRRSASPAGPGATPPGSGAASSSPAQPGSDLDMALALERGRPDIQEFFVMEQESRDRADREARERAERDQAQLVAAGYSPG